MLTDLGFHQHFHQELHYMDKRVLSKLLGHALITWLPQEAVRSNLPGVFIKAGYKKCRVILDCAEVFIDQSH